jgi:repressor LexA
MPELTERQRDVLRAIHEIGHETGYPPTVRELCKRIGVRSSCTVQRHLEALQRKGFIRRHATKARTVEIIRSPDPTMLPHATRTIPLLGAVAAGQPLLAVESIEGVYSLPTELVPSEDCFMLRVQGESMIGAGLADGDLVVVHRQATADDGEIVVALIDDEATVKRFFRERGRIRLQPENPAMKPIFVKRAAIIGKVIMAIKRFG